MTIRNLELKDLIYWFPSREGARKQLRNGRGVLYAMFRKYPFQNANYYRFTNTPTAAQSTRPLSRGEQKTQIADNHKKSYFASLPGFLAIGVQVSFINCFGGPCI
jgi:hypothetical protein